MQIQVLINKYKIIIDNGKLYLSDTVTEEAMEISEDRLMYLIKNEFKRM